MYAQVELILSLVQLLGVDTGVLWQGSASSSALRALNAAATYDGMMRELKNEATYWMDITSPHEGKWLANPTSERAAFIRRLLWCCLTVMPYCSPLCYAYLKAFPSLEEVRLPSRYLWSFSDRKS